MGEEGTSANRPLEKPFEVDTWALFETGKRGEEGWGPFITVPESLGGEGGSRGSGGLELEFEKAYLPWQTV